MGQKNYILAVSTFVKSMTGEYKYDCSKEEGEQTQQLPVLGQFKSSANDQELKSEM